MANTCLLLHVIKRVGRVDGEADENNMGVRVRERSQAVVVFLPCGIPQRQLNVLSINFNIRDVVLEDSWDVDLRNNTEMFQ